MYYHNDTWDTTEIIILNLVLLVLIIQVFIVLPTYVSKCFVGLSPLNNNKYLT